MNIHSKIVGAIDAIVLCSMAAMTLVMLFVLFSSPLDDPRFTAEASQRQHFEPVAAAITEDQEVRI